MNAIKLNKPVLIKGKYCIFLDSENKFTFSDKRKASDFLVQVSQELEKATLLITEEFNNLNAFYRLYYLADKDYRFKYKLTASLDLISNRLNWINDHSLTPNSDTIIFSGLVNCFEELTSAFSIMMIKAGIRKDTLTKRRCSLKIDILKMYLNKFLNLGIKPNVKVLPMAVAFKKIG